MDDEVVDSLDVLEVDKEVEEVDKLEVVEELVVVETRFTVTVNVPLAMFPAPSVPLHLTMVVPTLNTAPKRGKHATLAGPVSSSTLAL